MDNVPQYLNSKYFSSLSYVFGKYVEIASTNKKTGSLNDILSFVRLFLSVN